MADSKNTSLRRTSNRWFWAATLLVGIGLTLGLSALSTPPGPDLNVMVDKFAPTGKTTPQTNITITFSNTLVDKDSLNIPVLDPPLTFQPPLPGVARWIATDKLRFFPDNPLAPATTYTVRVRSDKTFAHGNRLNEKREFTLSTSLLSCQRVWYYTEKVPDTVFHSRIRVTLQFNYPVSAEDLKRHLEIKGGDNATEKKVDYELVLLSDDGPVTDDISGYHTDWQVVTESILQTEEQQEYTLTVLKGLRCENCGEGLSDDYRHQMLLEQREYLTVTSCRSEQMGEKFSLALWFTTPVSPDDFRAHATIEPAIEYTVAQRYSGLLVSGDFRPGETYEIAIDDSLRAVDGSPMERNYQTRVSIPDLSPTVTFATSGVYLPRQGLGNIAVKTINVDSLTVEVERVFENNLVYFLNGENSYIHNNRSMVEVGKDWFSREIALSSPKNEPLITTVDLGGIIGDTARGIFVVSARARQQRWYSDSRRAIRTDLGITARMADNFLQVWVNSLETTKPIGKATVRLYSRNNQVLVEGKTDSRGVAVFDDLAAQTEGFDPFVIVVSHRDDFSYLKFADCLLPTGDFDVSGRPYLDKGYEAFVYTDRGVYRPGDTVHLMTLVRGVDAAVPKEFPYVVKVFDPRSRLFQETRLTTGGTALNEVTLEIPTFANTGNYAVTVRIGDDYVIGRSSFLVEEFMPDRIKVTVETPKAAYVCGDVIDIDVTGTFLFGPPASEHRVQGKVALRQKAFQPDGFSGYTFSTSTREFREGTKQLSDTTLDRDGHVTYTYQVPVDLKPPAALSAIITAEVSEQSGRSVAASREITINPYRKYLGVKTDLKGYAKVGDTVGIRAVCVNTEGKAVAANNVKVRFVQLVYNTVVRRDNNGRNRYVSELTRQALDSSVIAIADTGAYFTFVPPTYGRFEVEIADETPGQIGHAAATRFYASGWGYAPWSLAEPGKIDLDLDRTSYTPGGKASVQIRAPFSGTLLLTVERDRVLDVMTLEMEENTAVVDLPIRKDYFPNAYVTATIIRPAAKVTGDAPARAFGMAPLMIDKDERTLGIAITAPDVIKPRRHVTVGVQLDREVEAQVTLALIDQGILQLTSFTTPDPLDFFYGKKRPYLRAYDMYDFLYPETERAASHLSPAGGMAAFDREVIAADMQSPINAMRYKPVALWSGLVTTDKQGHIDIDVDVPQFNGQLTVMAVAAYKDAFGSATGKIIVRDNIVLMESFPRFIAPGDTVNALVSVFNNTDKFQSIAVGLDADGPMKTVTSPVDSLSLTEESEGAAYFTVVAAAESGKIDCNITARTSDDSSLVSFELPNRPPQPLRTESGSAAVNADSVVTFTIPGEWLRGTDKYVLQTSSLAAVALARDIQDLLGYPYGCLEQTTSKVFPLLYFEDLARFVQPELIGGRGHEYYVLEGIKRLEGMLRNDGSFPYWPGGNRVHQWSTVYATHFLVEARKAGYDVNNDTYKSSLSYIKRVAEDQLGKHTPDVPERVYAIMVLAKAGKVNNRMLNYLRDLNPNDLPSFTRYQMAIALAISGDRDLARSLVPTEIHPETFAPETGGTFSSGVRTNAILLDLLMELDPSSPSAATIVHSLLTDARANRWFTTQASSFAFMALGKYFKGRQPANFTGTLEIVGDTTYRIDTAAFRVDRRDLGGKQVRVRIDGQGPCYVYWQAAGVSSNNVIEEYDKGIEVRREYLNEDGEPLDLNTVKPGDRIIAHITAKSQAGNLHNVVIVDLLPACMEIENSRLGPAPKLEWIGRPKSPAEYQDIRDDRLLLFMDLNERAPFESYYSLRCVANGAFVVPPVAAQCMYNPNISSASSSGRMTTAGKSE